MKILLTAFFGRQKIEMNSGTNRQCLFENPESARYKKAPVLQLMLLDMIIIFSFLYRCFCCFAAS
jgi:hypothetical protein